MALAPITGTDDWSLFLRQRRLKDQLRRLRNDYKDCHCPPGCRGGPQNHVAVDPGSLPDEPLHGPPVDAGSAMPMTSSRTTERRHRNCMVIAEARGTSDVRLHRGGARATLRMSLQVHTDATLAGRLGYYGEMFVARHGRPEEFAGFIAAWLVDRTTGEWEGLYLDEGGSARGDMGPMQDFFRRLFGYDEGQPDRDQDGRRLPVAEVRDHFGAPWAMLNDDTDIVYIPFIWVTENFSGNRIIDQGFELFFRLMTGGTLPEPYNLSRPLTVLLEAGLLGSPYDRIWNQRAPGYGSSAEETARVIQSISRTYRRSGFMHLQAGGLPGDRDETMGRRVEQGDHPAARGDVAIIPPDPPATDLSTPSPERRLRQRRQAMAEHAQRTPKTPETPSAGREGTRPRDGAGGGGGGGGGEG